MDVFNRPMSSWEVWTKSDHSLSADYRLKRLSRWRQESKDKLILIQLTSVREASTGANWSYTPCSRNWMKSCWTLGSGDKIILQYIRLHRIILYGLVQVEKRQQLRHSPISKIQDDTQSHIMMTIYGHIDVNFGKRVRKRKVSDPRQIGSGSEKLFPDWCQVILELECELNRGNIIFYRLRCVPGGYT